MVASGCENQQSLGERVHRLIQHHAAQGLGQRGSARLAGLRDHPALRQEGLGQTLDVAGFSGAINAFEADEQALV